MKYRFLPLMFAGVFAVAACSRGSETAETTFQFQVLQTLKEQIALRRAPKAERPQLTRAALDALEGSFLEVTVEKSGVFAFMGQVYRKQDQWPGEVVVWQTEDNVTLTLREGVLVGTRGLRNDVISASALVQGGGREGPIQSGKRVFEIRGGDSESVSYQFNCTVNQLGVEQIEIVELNITTERVQEKCRDSGVEFVNDYWRDTRTGKIWQSRQWFGPENGYLVIKKLTD